MKINIKQINVFDQVLVREGDYKGKVGTLMSKTSTKDDDPEKCFRVLMHTVQGTLSVHVKPDEVESAELD